ncbi:MAG: hypothetical protein H8D67_31355 [Deltaproteobacteria bacterium]|nr:hypothetical protein [Deltaproteobacteria bacterium]
MARGIERRKLFRDDKDLELTEVGFLISDLCPLTSGPLELIRYIHLNPLRAGIVNDLKELDKYRWTGHSVILGKRKNPLAPYPSTKNKSAIPNPCPVKREACLTGEQSKMSLADKTIQDVLLHFGETKKVARRRYRQFVKNGIDQGKRPELQGGGLVRSAGGEKAGLLGRKNEEREKGDARILGSGDFVAKILHRADSDWDRRQRYHVSLGELISKVAKGLNINEGDLLSSKRQSRISDARAIICYLAVMELDVKGIHVGKALKISGQSVSRCIDRGRNLLLCREMPFLSYFTGMTKAKMCINIFNKVIK